jgi:Fuc2NAc and GlcNAc transferase
MLICIYIIVFLLSFTGTFIIIKVAHRKNILDVPNLRSSHTEPTPRGGGLAIVLTWYLGLLGLRYLNLLEADLFYALISGSVLAVIGLLDDLYSLKPWIRMLFQVLTVIAGLYFLKGFNTIYLGSNEFTLHFIFTLIALIGAVWFVNLFNFLDGIDGYASIEAIAVASGMYIVTNNPIFLILILSVSGFLLWNWPKARIFMGDIGSTQLGYILVILGIYFNNNHELNIFGWMTLTSLFWIDATITLLRRWRNKEKLSEAHKKHAYQRIVQYGFSHQKTILFALFINIIFIVLVYLSEHEKVSYYITVLLCLVINYLIIKQIDMRFPFPGYKLPQSKQKN